MLSLTLPHAIVRPYRLTDVEALARIANDAEVARHLNDRFPHPYTLDDARGWVRFCAAQAEPVDYAIEVDGQLAGGIGLKPGQDVYRLSAELGYWLGRSFWGRGLATEIAKGFSDRVFERTKYVRLWAHVYETNPASMRVLEKSGFQREGILRRAVLKHGRQLDVALYARLRG